MLGQSFFPGGSDDRLRQQQDGQAPVNPIQEAIKVLSLKMPRVPGASAPAPPSLLMGLGSAGMPSTAPPGLAGPGAQGPVNPLAALIQQMFAPGAQAQAAPMGGGPMQPPPTQGKVRTEFIPDPNSGTATDPRKEQGPGRGPWSDLPNPLPTGGGRRPTSV